MRRNSSHHRVSGAARREEILDEVLAVIADVGVDGVRMRALAERLPLSAAALYRHFTSREQLLDAAVERVFALLRVEIAQATARHPAGSWERVRAFAETYLVFMSQGGRFPAFLRMRMTPRRGRHSLGEEACFLLLGHLVRQSMGAGDADAADADTIALFLWCLLQGVALASLFPPTELPSGTSEQQQARDLLSRFAPQIMYGLRGTRSVT